MFFSDIHIHLLCNTDDGPQTAEEMYKMVDAAYQQGTRLICVTPHFAPSDFGNNSKDSEAAFAMLTEYCEKYKDLSLFMGNELFCVGDELQWLKNGYCKTMNNTRYVLAEFPFMEKEKNIIRSLETLLGSGYVPIIAHAERYFNLSIKQLFRLQENGVLVQINVPNNALKPSFKEKCRVKKLLSNRLVDFVSTDAHNLTSRPPYMEEFYNTVSKKYGEEYANAVFCTNAEKLLTEEN